MSQVMMQVNAKCSISRAELEQAWLPAAPVFAELPGLVWKVWIVNEVEGTAGGLLLFDSMASADAYLHSELIQAVAASPFLSDIDVKLFDILTAHSAITRGPVGEKEQA